MIVGPLFGRQRPGMRIERLSWYWRFLLMIVLVRQLNSRKGTEAVYDLSGTGKNLGVLTEIPPLWFAGASDQPIGNMRWNIIVECVGEDGKQSTITLGTIERLAGSTTAE